MGILYITFYNIPITESQIFIALFITLINGFLALRLGSSLYRDSS